MPSKKYLHDIDLVQNQLLNAVLDSRSSAPSSGVDGQIYYNNASKQFFYYNGTTSLWEPIGGTSIATEARQLIREVYNNSGATMTKGTVVYINSGHGNLPTIAKALATADATSAQTYGVVQNDISDNSNGYIVVIGDLLNIDTQAFTVGTQLYLSGTTAGAYTSTKQYAPIHLVYVGIVTRSHPTQGVIAIRIQNGYEMDELHDVSAQNPSNNDILQYKTATGLWTKVAGTTANISEVTNLYFTDARARLAISLTTTGSSGAATYSNTTGVLNIPTYTLAGLGGLTNPMTTLGDIIYGGASGAVTRLAGNITTTRQFLSQTGTGSASAAPAWATIAGSDITGAALTSSNDTNVTITLGGTPATSLLRAASLTLGWTGTLAVSRGGTGLGSLGTANQLIRVNAGATALEYFTPTYLTANQSITLSGDVTGTGTTAITTTIANNAVTLAKFQQIATSSFLGRVTAATGNIEVLSGTQATSLLDVFTSTLKGLVPLSGGGTSNFLRADGTWAVPAGGGGGTPAGSNTQIQYNNSGAFGASNKLTWNESTRVLNVGDGSADSAIEIYSRNVSNGWAGRFLGDYVTGQFYIQHRNNSATWQTCLFFNGNTSGQTYMVDKAYVVGLGILMVNTSVDNGVDKLQVNGSMSVGSIKSSGNVGIFNSSPFYALSVGDGTSTRQVVINGLNSGTAGGSSIAVQTNSLTTIMFGNKSNVIGGAYDGQPLFGYGGSTNSLQFYNFNTLAVTAMISSGDRFLIGTTTDNNADRLQVNGSAIATALKITGGTSSQVLYADGSTKQITSGTATPTGGSDGDIYLQYV